MTGGPAAGASVAVDDGCAVDGSGALEEAEVAALVCGLLLKRLPRLVTAKIRPTTSTAARSPPTSQRMERGSRLGSSSSSYSYSSSSWSTAARAEAGKLHGARSAESKPAAATPAAAAAPPW